MSDIQFLRELTAVFPNFHQHVAETFGPQVAGVVAQAAAPPTPVSAGAAPAQGIVSPGPGKIAQPPAPATPTQPTPAPAAISPPAVHNTNITGPGHFAGGGNFGSLLGAAKAPILGKRPGA